MEPDADVLLFPIRHHSPACAWHLARLIAAQRPRAVLIEGPRDATALIPAILHPATRAPIAVYTTWVDRKNFLGRPAPDGANPARFAAYYPLADFSPELVALRAGQAAGATLAFIDLPFPALIVAEHGDGGPAAERPQVRSLLDEHHFQHSRFLQALCAKTGARDPDDLWDHLYEADPPGVTTEEFIRRVETYCALSRADYTPATLAAEGHPAREAAMAAAIAAEATRGPGLVLAVTGGFHTPGLRALLESDGPPAAPPPPPPGDAQTLLMRYGFAQLDRLNGYASGMPAPAFYQRTWDLLNAEGTEPAGVRVAAEFLVEMGRRSRERAPGLSPADEIAALDQVRRLAAFRGHARPTREDLLDGVRSAFVKGPAEAEGALLLREARRLLAGDRIGDLPPGAGVAPLVEDFRQTAAAHRINLTTHAPQEVVLDLYRRAAHRVLSRFFYRLEFLEVPFARLVRGPDFVAGRELERMQEVWRYAWTPDTESTLTERALYGGTLEEASAARLQEGLAAAGGHGQGRRAEVAATALLQACRMGLHRFAPDLLAHTAALIAEDAAFVSLVHTAESLLLLHVSREPLEAHDLPGVPEVAARAYERACYLLADLGSTAPADEGPVLDGLNALAGVALALGAASGPERAAIRDGLRRTGLRALLDGGGNPAVRGAAAGGLFADGALDAAALVPLVSGYLDLHGPAFLRGLLYTARSCLWQVPALLAALTRALAGWPPEHFVRVLPELRLAFATLSAGECDRVARQVAAHLGVRAPPPRPLPGATEADLLLGAALDARVTALLARDGLRAWTASGEDPG